MQDRGSRGPGLPTPGLGLYSLSSGCGQCRHLVVALGNSFKTQYFDTYNTQAEGQKWSPFPFYSFSRHFKTWVGHFKGDRRVTGAVKNWTAFTSFVVVNYGWKHLLMICWPGCECHKWEKTHFPPHICNKVIHISQPLNTAVRWVIQRQGKGGRQNLSLSPPPHLCFLLVAVLGVFLRPTSVAKDLTVAPRDRKSVV